MTMHIITAKGIMMKLIKRPARILMDSAIDMKTEHLVLKLIKIRSILVKNKISIELNQNRLNLSILSENSLSYNITNHRWDQYSNK